MAVRLKFASGDPLYLVATMKSKPRSSRRPPWVYWGLWGLRTRGDALVYFWICTSLASLFFLGSLAMALAGIGVEYWIASLAVVAMLVPAGLWYGLAIRWVDQHDDWD